MKYFKRYLIIVIVMILTVACGQKAQVFLEKDGTYYEIGDQVSFYYPKNFEIDARSKNIEDIRFIKDQEALVYTTMKDDTENKVEDLPTLYEGQLKEDGAVDVVYHDITLDSGLRCQSFTGVFSASGMYFKHIVYFTSDATCIYAYQAPKDVYKSNVQLITPYLESLTVHHDKVSSHSSSR